MKTIGRIDRVTTMNDDATSMQPPLSCPLEAPEEWQRWADRLDPASWILYASEVIDGGDPHAMSTDELILMSELIDRRAAMVRELLANPAGDTVH